MFKAYRFYVDSFGYARAIVQDLAAQGVTSALSVDSRRPDFIEVVVIHNGKFEFPPCVSHPHINWIERAPEILSIESV